MKLSRVEIRNFRGLAEVDLRVQQDTNVIVGPNAIGKTTILQAIRIVNGVLMPRFQGEAQQTLQSIGAFDPHIRQISFESLQADLERPASIRLDFRFDDDELDLIRQRKTQLAAIMIQDSLGALAHDQLSLSRYLSTDEGKERLNVEEEKIATKLARMSSDTEMSTTLHLDGKRGLMQGTDAFAQQLVSLLGLATPVTEGIFSYFQADRALPTDQPQIQIGAADATQKLQSHIAKPEIKHQRLKHYLVNETLSDLHEGPARIRQDFAAVFEALIPGKEFVGISVSNRNTVSVKIRETKTGAVYDIDQMSSGEKGLLLLFFLARRTVKRGGILLIDEPELHLNPRVCKGILPFIVEHIQKPLALQVFICTHSPEILGAAYERDDCALWHLRSGRDLTPVLPEDKDEVYEALKRLGSATADVLFSRGGVFVEGPHDVDLLEDGFGQRLSGYKVTSLGGRGEIEKEIANLQKVEQNGELDTRQVFIFDNDGRPTDLGSTKFVRVLQWDRYCLENYLLDETAIFDAWLELPKRRGSLTRGETLGVLRKLANSQLPSLIAKRLYANMEPENAGWRAREIRKLESFEQIAVVLATRLAKVKSDVADFEQTNWVAEFTAKCEAERTQAQADWDARWISRCNGKVLLEDFHRTYCGGISPLDFKRRVMRALVRRTEESWRLVDSILAAQLDP